MHYDVGPKNYPDPTAVTLTLLSAALVLGLVGLGWGACHPFGIHNADATVDANPNPEL